MNALGTLLTVVAIIVGAVVLIPILGVVLGLAVAFGGVVLWLLPIVLIGGVRQGRDGRKDPLDSRDRVPVVVRVDLLLLLRAGLRQAAAT